MVSALNRKLIRDLKSLKYQVLTIALLVTCGVALFISAWSTHLSLQTARDTFYLNSRFSDLFATVRRGPADLGTRLKVIPGIESVELRAQTESILDLSSSKEPVIGQFVSIFGQNSSHQNLIHLIEGRFPSEERRLEVLIHEKLAQAHKLKIGDHIKAIFNSQQRELTISGIAISPEYIYPLSSHAPLPDNKRFGVLWMNDAELKGLLGLESAFNSLTVKIGRNANINDVKAQVNDLIYPFGSAGAYTRDKQISNAFISDEINQQRVSAIYNPMIFLAITTFLIYVLVSRLISMQRGQIATLKACGFYDHEIFGHYFKMAFLMLLAGVIPGLLAGNWLGNKMTDLYRTFYAFPNLRFILSPSSLAIGTILGIVPGLGSAWFSIRQVYRMHPAEAMLPPAPHSFKHGLMDALFTRFRSGTRMKMSVRNLFANPFRFTLTTIGVSLSVAIIIMGYFWVDVTDYISQTYFEVANHSDIDVIFDQPKPPGVLEELRKMTGVIEAEGSRQVPIRIQHLQHSREITLSGFPPQSRLKRVLDNNRQDIKLSPNGLTVSQYFRNNWGLRVGDVVQITTLDGRRKFSLPVMSFSEDLIGQTAYIPFEKLFTLMDENPSYNLAFLRIDKKTADSLYIELKQKPGIYSVMVNYALFKGFQETMASAILTITYFLIFFSVLICIGVIYNTARVSFSERAWEFASLRIFGFRLHETVNLFLWETFMIVLIALFPGLGFGYLLAKLSIGIIKTETFTFPLVIDISTYIFAVSVTIFASLLSSIVIYRLFKNLKSIEALKLRE